MLYPIAIEKGDKKHAYGIIVPDIVGCFSASDEKGDIFHNATEAIALHLEGLLEDGEEIPIATSIDNYIDNPNYQGMTWALIPIDISKYLGKAEKINITLPSNLVHKIDEKVLANKKLYKSRSNYLAQLAEKDLLA
ncbi:MAG: type II toxin-antitoxin system HicB family antitoxin [Moraxellaceae bacterium]|nr:type II toxin-antitoxin system HicB family antitoxin [Moraxellaceae bacterium]